MGLKMEYEESPRQDACAIISLSTQEAWHGKENYDQHQYRDIVSSY